MVPINTILISNSLKVFTCTLDTTIGFGNMLFLDESLHFLKAHHMSYGVNFLKEHIQISSLPLSLTTGLPLSPPKSRKVYVNNKPNVFVITESCSCFTLPVLDLAFIETHAVAFNENASQTCIKICEELM